MAYENFPIPTLDSTAISPEEAQKRILFGFPAFEALSVSPDIEISDDNTDPSYIEGLQLVSQVGGFELVTTGAWNDTGAIRNNTGFTLDMLGVFEMYPDNQGAASRIEVWSEVSADEGVSSTENALSARIMEVPSSGESTQTKSSRIIGWQQGELLRFAMYDSGGGSITLEQAEVDANGAGIIYSPVFFWSLAATRVY